MYQRFPLTHTFSNETIFGVRTHESRAVQNTKKFISACIYQLYILKMYLCAGGRFKVYRKVSPKKVKLFTRLHSLYIYTTPPTSSPPPRQPEGRQQQRRLTMRSYRLFFKYLTDYINNLLLCTCTVGRSVLLCYTYEFLEILQRVVLLLKAHLERKTKKKG